MLENVTDKSFLSFTFDGRAIEEFGFAVVYDGDRFTMDMTPDFSNNLQSISGKRGSLYWGTDIGASVLPPIMTATDQATSRQISDLKAHFIPGKLGKLTLAESAYKYYYALLASKPEFEFIPFESSIIVAGKTYFDTLYKGSQIYNFIVPDAIAYSDLVFGDDYENEPWFLESGLPLQSWLPTTITNLAHGIRASKTELFNDSVEYNGTSITCYHAGNNEAPVNLLFSKQYQTWTDLVIGDTIIHKPRIMRNVDYAVELLQAYRTDWSNSNKALVLNTLRENLDSAIRDQIIGITQATGTGLKWTTVDEGIAAIKALIAGVSFKYSVNAIEKQVVISATINGYDFGINVDSVIIDIVDNIGDSFNGQYIFMKPTSGVSSSGELTYQTITFSTPVDNIRVYFSNCYV